MPVSFEINYLKNQGASKYGDSWDFSGVKFNRLEFGVLLENVEVKLPEPLNTRFLGVAAIRAEVTIKIIIFMQKVRQEEKLMAIL